MGRSLHNHLSFARHPKHLLLSFMMWSFHLSWSSSVTPRYTTDCSGWSSTLFRTSFVSLISLFLCFLPKTIRCVFFKFTMSWFCLYQSNVDWASEPRASTACSAILASVYRVVSSAYIFMHPRLPVLGRSFTNGTNISGPRIEPWGTPYLGISQGQLTFPVFTPWRLPLK